jgi:hypothetical protein
MGIKPDILMETPLSDDDRDTPAGISVMLLAITNRQNLAHLEIDLPRPCREHHPARPEPEPSHGRGWWVSLTTGPRRSQPRKVATT